MKPASRIVNPYLSRKKNLSSEGGAPPQTNGGSKSQAKPTYHKAHVAAPLVPTKGSPKETAVTYGAKTPSEPPKIPSAKPVNARPPVSLRNPLTLKQRLKQDIENLKRAKIMQKQKAEEQKRRREQEVLRHKAEKAAQKLAEQQHAAADAASSQVQAMPSAASQKPPVTPLATTKAVSGNHSPKLTVDTVEKTQEPDAALSAEVTPDKPFCCTDTRSLSLKASSCKVEKVSSSVPSPKDKAPVTHNIENRPKMLDILDAVPKTEESDSPPAVPSVPSTQQILSSGGIESQPFVSAQQSPSEDNSNPWTTNLGQLAAGIAHSNAFGHCTQPILVSGFSNAIAHSMNRQQLAHWHSPGANYLNWENQLGSPYGFPVAYPNSFGFSMPVNPMWPYVRTASLPGMYNGQSMVSMAKPVAPQAPKPVVSQKLAQNVLESPSPYASTHRLLVEPIILRKESPTASFGISMGVDSASALVEPEWLDRLHGVTVDSAEKPPLSGSSTGQNPSQPSEKVVRRRRRRRHVFSAMMVLDPSKQNSRGVDRKTLLQNGDIILKIGPHETAGISFSEACQLFRSADLVTKENEWYCLRVVVARRRPSPSPKVHILPLVTPMSIRSVTSADVTRWCFLRFSYLFNTKRVIGTSPSESDLQRVITLAGPSFSELTLPALETAWQQLALELRRKMSSSAAQHWREEWMKELPEIRQATERAFLTDAQRSRLRASGRPTNGCKCGSKTHEFVNSPLCPLYSNLRRLGKLEDLQSIDSPTAPKSIRFQERKLKTVEAAFTERIVRERAEKDREEAEALFVGQAEEIQLRELGQSIFSPSLTSMILSSIAALKEEFDAIKARKQKAVESRNLSQENQLEKATETKVDEEDDEDDDVPLEELAKRSLSRGDTVLSKKFKSDTLHVDYECLARVLRYISKRWGHCYLESPDVDYAWRWELFHGQMGTSNWETNAKNPRKGLSLENIRFLVDDKTINSLRFDGEPDSLDQAEAMKILCFVTDPSRTGIVDEILALQQSGVVRIDCFGVPRLSSTWFQNVDVLVLEEMMVCWSVEVDPLGRYGMNSIIRKLSTKWIRHDEGWALTSAPDDIIFESAEFATWREAFETKHEEKADDVHGIGRFGI